MAEVAIPVLAGFLYPPGIGVITTGTLVGATFDQASILANLFASGTVYRPDGTTEVVDETLYATLEAAYQALLPDNSALIASLAAGFSTYVADPEEAIAAGIHLNSAVVPLAVSGSGGSTVTASGSYTPVSDTSKILVHVDGYYVVSGTGADTWYSTLAIGGVTKMTKQEVYRASTGGGGGRGSPLLPLDGSADNSATSAVAIVTKLFRNSSDDTVSLSNATAYVTEISR